MSVNCVCELFVCVARYGPVCASENGHGPAVGVSRSVPGVSLAAVSAGETLSCVCACLRGQDAAQWGDFVEFSLHVQSSRASKSGR